MPAGAAAAVRDVEVDLAQTAERLGAQRRTTLEPVEHAEVGRLVDVDPERQLRDLQACGLRRAQRVLEQAGAAHRGRREHRGEGAGRGGPRLPAGADQVVAAVRRRAEDEAPGREFVEGPGEVLRRERRAVAADDDDRLRAGAEQVGEDVREPLAEAVAALRQPRPAAVATGERVTSTARSRRLAAAATGPWRPCTARAAGASASTSAASGTRSALSSVPRSSRS